MIDNTGARRNTNKVNAIALAKIGVAVFPSSGKVPLIPRFNKLDTEISLEDREAIVAEYREAHDGRAPKFIGSTKDVETVKQMWRAFPDAVPSVACGPSNLVVVDADAKDNGPELVGALFAENGGVPEGVFVSTTRSGGQHFVFADPEGAFSNSAGRLKKSYGCDVRGKGGQFVAPGSIREDGKTYGTRADLAAFCRAFASQRMPPLPQFITELIGATPEAQAPLTDADPVIRSLIEQLGATEWPDFESTFDANTGKYCLECVEDRSPDFSELYRSPSADRSTNRFNAARYLIGAHPEMTVTEYAAFCEQWDGAGDDYNHRALAREYAKAKLSPEYVARSTGEAFGVVEDEEPEASQSGSKPARYVFIEDIRVAAIRLLDWCVKWFVARGTTSVATGLWGAGKTAVFSDIGLHVGHGFEWRGRKVKQGVVIYVALENTEDVERRVATWCEVMEKAGRDVSHGSFVVYRGPCRLFDSSGKPTRDEKDLIEVARTAAAHYGLPVAMIVIDTLAQSIAPGDDNSAKDAGIYTAAMQRIVAATGANVTALAHPTKSGDGVRGSGALQANVDTIIEVSRDASGKGTIKSGSKFRIGNPAKVNFGYRLRSETIGRDDDGDDIDVVLAVEPPSLDMAVTEDDDEAPTLTPSDRREDRIQAVLDVFSREAERQKADDESLPAVRKRIELASGEIEKAVNARRRSDGLEALGRSTVQDHIRAAVETGGLEAVGTKARPLYRLG